MGDGDAEAEDEAADDEERDVEADADEGDADEHDGAADDDAGAAAEDVGGVGDEGDGEHGADGHGGGDEAEDLAVGVVEVYVRVSQLRWDLEGGLRTLVPSVDGFEAVHERAVVAWQVSAIQVATVRKGAKPLVADVNMAAHSVR